MDDPISFPPTQNRVSEKENFEFRISNFANVCFEGERKCWALSQRAKDGWLVSSPIQTFSTFHMRVVINLLRHILSTFHFGRHYKFTKSHFVDFSFGCQIYLPIKTMSTVYLGVMIIYQFDLSSKMPLNNVRLERSHTGILNSVYIGSVRLLFIWVLY